VSRFAELILQHKAISKKVVRQCQTANFEEFVYLLLVNIFRYIEISLVCHNCDPIRSLGMHTHSIANQSLALDKHIVILKFVILT